MEEEEEYEEESPECPECGWPLNVKTYKDEESGEITIELWCDGAGDDVFKFVILTGLKNNDLKKLKQVGKTINKEMQIKLLERRKE